ncbi:MAG: hypothetical protein KAU16_08345 [Methanophagales archaeon]|nr:hypothetical protein [Methanophagales archaeon]
MALKVLSGILITRGHSSGNATINFSDHAITGANFTVNSIHQLEFGAETPFKAPPCKIVAMLEIKVQETERPIHRERTEEDFLRIDDSVIDERRLQIKWRSSGGSQIEEISYMVVGETEDS